MFMYSMFMSWKTVLPFSKNFYLQHLLCFYLQHLLRFYIGVCFCVCWYLVFIKWKWKLKSRKYSHSKRKFERNILREKIPFLNWHVDDKYVKKTIPHDYCIKCFGFKFTSCEGFYLKFMLFTSNMQSQTFVNRPAKVLQNILHTALLSHYFVDLLITNIATKRLTVFDINKVEFLHLRLLVRL